MFCTQCGSEVEQHARFCSKCGGEMAAAVSAASVSVKRTERDMEKHINILAWLLIGSAILTGLGGMIVLFAGQIIRHLPIEVGELRELHFVTWITSVVGMFIIALGGATAAAGVGLLQHKDWARVFTVVMAVLLLFNFPIGTVIAVYAFWVLFSDDGQKYYKSRAESTMTGSGT